MKKGFTLIELLILIAILVILTMAIVLIINPANMLSRARDSRRLAELSSINKAIQIAGAQGGISLGTSTVIYVSTPDAVSSDCASLGLPTLPGGWTYHCANPANYRNVDGTGWIPVNFKSLNTNSPFGVLPVDPVNTTSTGLYYTYTNNNGQWAATTLFESKTYQEKYAATQNSSSTTVYSTGNSPSLTPPILLARGGGGGGGSTLSTPYVWVANFGDNAVTKLGPAGNTIGTYPVGGIQPYGIAIDALGNVWVTNSNGNSVTKLDSNGNNLGTYLVGSYPFGIAVDASGNIWVANSSGNTVTKLDSAGNNMGTYPVGKYPYSLGDMTGFALQYFVLGRR